MDLDFEAAWQKLTYPMMRKLNGLDANLTALLHSKDLLSFDEYEKVKSKTVTSDANEVLMASVRRRGRSGLDGLVQCLKEEAANADLVEAIQKEWPLPAPNTRVLPSTSDLTSRQMDERKLFTRYFAELKKSVTNPEEIAAQLLGRHVITNSERDAAVNTTSATQMDKLLCAVQRAIRIKKENFDIFMEVLEEHYADLVEKMKAARKEPKDEDNVFVTFYAKLRSDVNPENICADLFARDIISPAEKEDIEHVMTDSVRGRTNKLLTAVQAAIVIDEKNLHIFLEVLNMNNKYKPLVARMQKDLQPSIN